MTRIRGALGLTGLLVAVAAQTDVVVAAPPPLGPATSVDTLPPFEASDGSVLVGRTVAVVIEGLPADDPVAVAVAGRLGEAGAAVITCLLPEDRGDCAGAAGEADAVVLVGTGGDPVEPAIPVDGRLVIDARDHPAQPNAVAIAVDRDAADRLGGALAAQLAMDWPEAFAFGVIGFDPDEDPMRLDAIEQGVATIPGAEGLARPIGLFDPAWPQEWQGGLAPVVTMGVTPVVLTLQDAVTQAIVSAIADAGSGPDANAVIGIGCDTATLRLFSGPGPGILRACVGAHPANRADAVARILLAAGTGAQVPATVLVPPVAITATGPS